MVTLCSGQVIVSLPGSIFSGEGETGKYPNLRMLGTLRLLSYNPPPSSCLLAFLRVPPSSRVFPPVGSLFWAVFFVKVLEPCSGALACKLLIDLSSPSTPRVPDDF